MLHGMLWFEKVIKVEHPQRFLYLTVEHPQHLCYVTRYEPLLPWFSVGLLHVQSLNWHGGMRKGSVSWVSSTSSHSKLSTLNIMVSDFVLTLSICDMLVVLRGELVYLPFFLQNTAQRCPVMNTGFWNVNFELGLVVTPLPTRPCLKSLCVPQPNLSQFWVLFPYLGIS